MGRVHVRSLAEMTKKNESEKRRRKEWKKAAISALKTKDSYFSRWLKNIGHLTTSNPKIFDKIKDVQILKDLIILLRLVEFQTIWSNF